MKAAGGTASWRCFTPIARFRNAPMVMACRCGSMRWSCTGRGSGARAGWRVSSMRSWGQVKAALAAVAERRYPERDRVVVLLSVRAGLRAKEIAMVTWAMATDAAGDVGD